MALMVARIFVVNVAPPSVELEEATTLWLRENAMYVTCMVPKASTKRTEPWLYLNGDTVVGVVQLVPPSVVLELTVRTRPNCCWDLRRPIPCR